MQLRSDECQVAQHLPLLSSHRFKRNLFNFIFKGEILVIRNYLSFSVLLNDKYSPTIYLANFAIAGKAQK